MTDIQERLTAIKAKISQQNALQARAEVRKETATESLNQARTELRETFDVTTGAEIRAKKEALEKELAEALESAEALLEQSS